MLAAIFCSLVFLIGGARGYSDGAPPIACVDMVPQHGADPQQTECPYIFTAEPVGNNIQVIIKIRPNDFAYDYFKGFLIQARLANNRTVIVPGTFQFLERDPSLQHLRCSQSSGDAITHTSSDPKEQITAMWVPPQNFNGQVIFRATILRNSHIFWIGQETQALSVATGKSEDSPAQENIQNPVQRMGTENMDQDCTKNCMRAPEGCIVGETCQIVLTYDKIDGKIQFELKGQNVDPGSYLAMGLSDDAVMGSDSVTECILSASQRPEIRQSWNEGHSNIPLNDATIGLSDFYGEYINKELKCRWRRDLNTTVRRRTFDLETENFFILLAKGPVLEDGNIRRHRLRIASVAPVNLTTLADVGTAKISPLVQLHGTLMVIAWLLLVNLGIVLARHYKPIWQEYMPCNVKVWFFLHRGFMLLACGLIIISVIIIFVDKKGWSSTNPHTIVGIIATVFAVLQPISALFRPDPTHPKRFLFNWGHLIIGNSAHFCAIGAIFLSAHLPDTEYLYPILNYPLAIYIAGFVFSHIMLHFVLWAIKKRVGNDIKIGELSISQPAGATTSKSPPAQDFKKYFLLLYSLSMAIIVITIVIFIWSE